MVPLLAGRQIDLRLRNLLIAELHKPFSAGFFAWSVRLTMRVIIRLCRGTALRRLDGGHDGDTGVGRQPNGGRSGSACECCHRNNDVAKSHAVQPSTGRGASGMSREKTARLALIRHVTVPGSSAY